VGSPPELEILLQRIGPSDQPAALAELIRVELELRRERDETPTLDEYHQRWPQLADAVNAAFDDDGRRTTQTRDQPVKSPGSGLGIRCPHCHNPIELIPDAPLDQVDCPTCGSHFSLTDSDGATRDANAITHLGQFELVERVGMGAFGTVWKARDTQLGRTVAVKVPRRGALDSQETEKFLREARSMAQLRHPNIVPVHEVGRDDETLYIVSDYIRGVPLSAKIADSRMSFREAAELLIKVASALHHAHEKGIVHRDLKPQNIMLDGNGEVAVHGISARVRYGDGQSDLNICTSG
jgi:serine/threonine protein kinase